jgi:hypothetical protein
MDAPIVDRGSKAICFTDFLLADSTHDLIATVLARPDADAGAVQRALIAHWHDLADALEQVDTTASAQPNAARRVWHGHDEHCVEDHLMVALYSLDHAHWARVLRHRS